MPGDGSMKRLVPAATYFESPPNMFSINRHGERWEGMFCTMDPEVRTVSIEAIKPAIRSCADRPRQKTGGCHRGRRVRLKEEARMGHATVLVAGVFLTLTLAGPSPRFSKIRGWTSST